MHFRCTQCPNEFCSGCGGTIKKGEVSYHGNKTYPFSGYYKNCYFFVIVYFIKFCG